MNSLLRQARSISEPNIYIPEYSPEVVHRILVAKARAKYTPHRHAWLMGRSEYTGATCFMVCGRDPLSTDRYYPEYSDNPAHGGYVYAEGLDDPLVWITCTCPAWTEGQQPCWHAAKVYARLCREHHERR